MRNKEPMTDLDKTLKHLEDARKSLDDHINGLKQEGLKKAIHKETDDRLSCLIAYLAGMQLAQNITKGWKNG